MGTTGKIILGTSILGLASIGLLGSDESEVSNTPNVSEQVEVILEEAQAADKTEVAAEAPMRVETAPQAQNCHPSYSGCLDPNASDYDCSGGSGNGPRYTGSVQVFGYDEFDLDRDNDGWGCE